VLVELASSYHEAAPSSAALDLACVWVGRTGTDGGYTDRILPDACIDVVWNGDRLFVAGPDTGPVILDAVPGRCNIGVRFRPGHAPRYLGVPASALLDQRVDVADLWTKSVAQRMVEQLVDVDPAEASARLEAMVLAQRTESPPSAVTTADDIVMWAPHETVDALADRFGCTGRTLHRRCIDAFGYGAKTLQRVLRFRRFLEHAESTPTATLAQIAADVGYADQSHLARDCTDFSALSPSALLVQRGVRSVQDGDGVVGA
jgi:AraC-like DNA-binding protein